MAREPNCVLDHIPRRIDARTIAAIPRCSAARRPAAMAA